MPITNLSPYSFLIVDDVRTTRITLQAVLKGLGSKAIYHADNGQEALVMLQNYASDVDCVISDFNMPVMNGLQMVKVVRCGLNRIRRDMPILMLTGHSDRNLFGVALALDVNAFLLKPAKKQDLLDRLSRILEYREKSVKPAESYRCIDVETSVQSLLSQNQRQEGGSITAPGAGQSSRIAKAIEKQKQKSNITLHARTAINQEHQMHGPDRGASSQVGDGALNAQEGKIKFLHIDHVSPNCMLAQDVIGSKEKKLLSKGTVLTRGMINSLKDLVQIGEPIDRVAVFSD